MNFLDFAQDCVFVGVVAFFALYMTDEDVSLLSDEIAAPAAIPTSETTEPQTTNRFVPPILDPADVPVVDLDALERSLDAALDQTFGSRLLTPEPRRTTPQQGNDLQSNNWQQTRPFGAELSSVSEKFVKPMPPSHPVEMLSAPQ